MNQASEVFVDRLNRLLGPFPADRGLSIKDTDDRGLLAA
jgi:hypothetical protein